MTATPKGVPGVRCPVAVTRSPHKKRPFRDDSCYSTHPAAAISGSDAEFEVKAAIATTVESATLPIPTAISPVELNSLTSEDAFRSSAFIRAIWSNFANLQAPL